MKDDHNLCMPSTRCSYSSGKPVIFATYWTSSNSVQLNHTRAILDRHLSFSSWIAEGNRIKIEMAWWGSDYGSAIAGSALIEHNS